MPVQVEGRAAPGRRTVLALVATAPALLATGGCGALLPGERRTPRPLTPDELAVERAAADAARLRDAALALAGQKNQPAAVLKRVAAEHEAHLEALGAVPLAGEVTAPPTATAAPPTDVRGQRDAEWAAARAALRDAVTADEGLAALLVRIAASRVLHADAVAAGRAPAPPDAPRPGGGAEGDARRRTRHHRPRGGVRPGRVAGGAGPAARRRARRGVRLPGDRGALRPRPPDGGRRACGRPTSPSGTSWSGCWQCRRGRGRRAGGGAGVRHRRGARRPRGRGGARRHRGAPPAGARGGRGPADHRRRPAAGGPARGHRGARPRGAPGARPAAPLPG